MKTYMILTGCALGLLSDPALAQSAANSPPNAVEPGVDDPGDAASSSGLADIVVTAQRRSENLQRAAVAVTAISGDMLLNGGVSRPAELTALVPSLQVTPSAGPYNLFYLRGVGNFNANALSDSAIAFNFNGVFVGRPSSTTGFFYDLERVEVVKGPQGTLYGRNATGGAINVLAKKPELGVFGGNVQAEYGSYNTARGDAALNIPVGDNAAVRLAGMFVRHDGYMRDGTDDQDDLGGRVSFRVDPSADLKITVVADYFRQHGRGVGGTPVELGVDDRPGYLSPEGQAFVASQPNVVLGQLKVPISVPSFQRNEYWGISSTVELATPAGTITVIPAYREGRLDYLTSTPGFYVRQQEKDTQTSLEVRLASNNGSRLGYIFGAFYYNESNDVPVFYVNQQSNINMFSFKQNIRSMAALGRLTYAITDNLRINAGARYTTEDKSLDGTLTARLRACVLPTHLCPSATPFPYAPSVAAFPPPNFDPTVDGTLTIPSFVDNTGANVTRDSVERVTYRLGADWEITSHNLVYASFETGFKSGGFFFTADSGVYRPESIKAWTIGSKNRFFDNRLQFNAEGFYWRYTDQQISHLITDSAGNAVFATENVGRATMKGFELETRLLATKTTELTFDVQYLDAKYDSFVYQTPNLNGGLGNGTSCPNLTAPAITYTVDCSGRRPPNAPQWTLNIGVQQTVPLANDAKFIGGIRGHYQTESLTGLEFTAPEYQSAYWMVDAQIGYHSPGGRYTITAFVNNMFNETVKSNTFPVPFTTYTSTSLRPPRVFGVRAGLSF